VLRGYRRPARGAAGSRGSPAGSAPPRRGAGCGPTPTGSADGAGGSTPTVARADAETWSTRCAARSTMRRPPQLWQNPRPRHENGTSRSKPHAEHRNRAKPPPSAPHHPNATTNGPQGPCHAASREKPGPARAIRHGLAQFLPPPPGRTMAVSAPECPGADGTRPIGRCRSARSGRASTMAPHVRPAPAVDSAV
jgi:hypothetical protein